MNVLHVDWLSRRNQFSSIPASVVDHRVIFLDQAKGKDVRYSLGVIPDRIGISREVTNLVGVCHSCVTMET